ncbi:MAG: OmpA family protein [Treponema sp.]|jgi:outer membrane protein OmpA-like peptidoglycan-associated protein|nr:OmpA family protein [Treponema sp.]
MMKKNIIILFILLALSAALCAQEKVKPKAANDDNSLWSLDFGFGMSGFLVDGTSYAAVFDPKFYLSPSILIGSKNAVNFSTDKIISLETQAYFRWNILRFPYGEKRAARKNTTDVFIQGGAGFMGALNGPDNDFDFDEVDSRSSLLADGTIGITIPLAGRWHIEPSARGGYPFGFAFSITTGYKFPTPVKTETIIRQLPPKTEYIELPGRVQYVQLPGVIEYVEQPPVIEYVEAPPREIEIIKNILIAQVEYILFAGDISKYNTGIDADARALNDLVINHLSKFLIDNPDCRIRIEGHANPVTHAPSEVQTLAALSANRANEVARLFREKGVPDDRIAVMSFGASRVLASDRTHWNMNRRVELIVFQGDFEKL